MLHFIYRIKLMLRQRTGMFWCLLFPVFLGMLFYFMLGNIENLEQFHEVPVGILATDMESSGEMFVETLKSAGTEDGTPMFAVTEYEDKDEANQALDAEEINGYITIGTDYALTVKESDINSSIIKMFIDQYMQNEALIKEVAMTHPERVQELVMQMFSEEAEIKEIPLAGQDKSPYTQYFYALLAMTCLFAANVGLVNGIDIQADLSMVAARRNVAPAKKMRQVMVDFLASYFMYCVLATLVLGICIFVYKQDFGSNAGFILLGTWVGSFVGIAAGTMIAVVFKGDRQKKQGLCVAFFLISSFFGGLQWGDITYYLEKSCPIVNRLNPATLIVNSFKSLAVFGDYQQYAVNLITLFLIGLLFLMISIWKLRRTQYASL
ncbi:MAG: ABC transporter permease [Lachnospiraceae bacterium]|nr:ABC transporter permease [Lachnospiraceae bacterium]